MKWGRNNRFSTDTAVELFMAKVEKDPISGCWNWVGAIGSHKRYGIVGVAGKHWLAHRAAWFLFKGLDPGKQYVCHHCDNGFCVNPDHLFIGDQTANMQDMERKGRAYHPACEKHGRAKLTNEQVKEIRLKHGIGISSRSLGREYGVSKTSILRIINGKGWLTK